MQHEKWPSWKVTFSSGGRYRHSGTPNTQYWCSDQIKHLDMREVSSNVIGSMSIAPKRLLEHVFAVCGCKGCILLPLRGAIVLSIQNKINIMLSIITTSSSFPMISISQIWRVWLLNWYMREWLFTSPHFIVYLLFCTYAWYYSHLFYVRMSCSHRPLYSLSLLSWMM